MTLENIFWYFPTTRGIDVVRLYVSTPYEAFTKEFDFDCRKSWKEQFKNNANLSDEFIDRLSNVTDFEFRVENESIVFEIQVERIRQYG